MVLVCTSPLLFWQVSQIWTFLKSSLTLKSPITKILLLNSFESSWVTIDFNQNTHSINCTPLTVAVTLTAVTPELLPFFLHNHHFLLYLSFCLVLHGPFLSPQASQIQFSPISRGGINWSVCRSNSLVTLHSTHWPVHASFRNWRKLDLRGLRRMN